MVPAPAKPLTTIFMTAAVMRKFCWQYSAAVKMPDVPTICGSISGLSVVGSPNWFTSTVDFT